MPKLHNERNAARWNNTTYQMHLDASRDLLASGGYGTVALTHALIALVLIQAQALEENKWGGSS